MPGQPSVMPENKSRSFPILLWAKTNGNDHQPVVQVQDKTKFPKFLSQAQPCPQGTWDPTQSVVPVFSVALFFFMDF